MENIEELLDRIRAARFLGISPATLDRLVKAKRIDHFRIGRRVLFAREGLEAFLSRCQVGPSTISDRRR
jgi:excisionase family DNA binding protein